MDYNHRSSSIPPSVPICSVVIPAYNAVQYAADAVRSALGQKSIKPEIIVVDDGSTDDTVASLSEFDDILLIRQDNRGRSEARMEGLRHATAPFVVFLDADDKLEPEAVAAHIAAMDAEPEAAMVFGSNHLINSSGASLGINLQNSFVTECPATIAHSVTPAPSQCMYRRTALNAVGGYDPTLELCEDIDLNIKMARIGKIICHGAVVAQYRLHSAQSTKRPSKICNAHLFVLKRHFGCNAMSPDTKTLTRCKRKWQRYYGQFIPSEILRHLARGHFRDALSSIAVYFFIFPQSFIGSMVFIVRRVKRR